MMRAVFPVSFRRGELHRASLEMIDLSLLARRCQSLTWRLPRPRPANE